MAFEPDRVTNDRWLARIAMEDAVCAGLFIAETDPDGSESKVEVAKVIKMLESSDFASLRHRQIYGVCKQLHANGQQILVPTVTLELAKHGLLELCGDEVELTQMVWRWFTALGITAYARQMLEEAKTDQRQATAQDQISSITKGIPNGNATNRPHWRA